MAGVGPNSLKLESFSPEETVVHEFAAGSRVEDAVERDLAVVPLLRREGTGLENPHRQLGVNTTHVVPVGAMALCETGEEEGGGEERGREEREEYTK